jgi:hypothetical protein
MFDVESQLFCSRLTQSGTKLVREGFSQRYTVMTLLGLQRSEDAGLKSPVEILPVLEGLLRDTAWVTNIGDLGLLLWICAASSSQRLQEVCSRVDLQRTFDQSREVREGRTMELAWFLSGLAHASLALPGEFQGIKDLAQRTFEQLRRNQGSHGFFGHLGRRGTVTGILRGGIGSFADQVYPIYAFSKFAQVYAAEEALERARNCADGICRVQGPLGQWWWHYNAATGRVAERYPVYSVHQEGMAPMALFALEEAGRLDYGEAINKGLRWISGHNELARDLREASGVVWRCIYHGRKHRVYLDRILSSLGSDGNAGSVNGLKVLPECRPYELGWLLYALAGRQSTTN